MKLWLRSTVVFWLAALAVVGCNGDDDEPEQLSKSEYQAEILEVIQDSVEPTALHTDLVVKSRPTDECARLMVRLRDQVDNLVERVAALEPPSEVAGIQDDFVAAARRSVDRVGAVQRQVAAGDVSCGRPLNDLLYGMPSSDRAMRAVAELEKRGYYVYGK